MQVLRPIYCVHAIKDEISIDDEIICGNCGVVKRKTVPELVHSESRTNLFIDVGMGGKQDSSIYANRYVHSNAKELGLISNICHVLEIPSCVSNDIWHWYNKIKSNIKMTKAKIAILVFYQLCRYHGFPISEKVLLEKTKFFFNVKHIHTFLNVMSEIRSFLDDNGVPIIEKIGFADLTIHNVCFLLWSKLKSLYSNFPHSVITEVSRESRNLSLTLIGSDEEIAKKAFNIAKIRCGIC